MAKKIQILFLAANPSEMPVHDIDGEMREITERLHIGRSRSAFAAKSQHAASATDLQLALVRFKPQIVHFSGNGSSYAEIRLEDAGGTARPVGADALVELFGPLKRDVRLVVLNSCFSSAQAAAISEVIDYTVGTSPALSDRSAFIFLTAFYSALATSFSVKDAFELGLRQLNLSAAPVASARPVLIVREGVDATRPFLAQPRELITRDVQKAGDSLRAGGNVQTREADDFDRGADSIERNEPKYQTTTVFVATDRRREQSTRPQNAFGPARGPGLQYGLAEVTIPIDRRLGSLPTWHWYDVFSLDLRPDPARHIILTKFASVDVEAFFSGVRDRVRASNRHDALVFVHGYNVTFGDAVRRTAQIAYDLQFEGAPICFTWPSAGRLVDYLHDANNVRWSVPHLRELLEELVARSGARSIHLIAHSMGNQYLTEALKEVAAGIGENEKPKFTDVILTAPDVDAEVMRQMASTIKRTAERVTLYASANDGALAASKRFQGYVRAGDASEICVAWDSMSTVDVSALDTSFVGHSYYGDNTSVLSDMYYLIRGNYPPDCRFGIKRHEVETANGRQPYWIFRPGV